MKNGKICFGVIIGTRAYFNSELARDVRKQLLKTLEDEGYEYIILPEDATPTGSSSIETREDGLKVSAQFREHRDEIDGIIVSLPNFGFEIGIINAIISIVFINAFCKNIITAVNIAVIFLTLKLYYCNILL